MKRSAAGACHLLYTKERSSEHFGKTGVPTSNIERFKRWFGQTDAYAHSAKNTELRENILLNYRRGQETEDECDEPCTEGLSEKMIYYVKKKKNTQKI